MFELVYNKRESWFESLMGNISDEEYALEPKCWYKTFTTWSTVFSKKYGARLIVR